MKKISHMFDLVYDIVSVLFNFRRKIIECLNVLGCGSKTFYIKFQKLYN